MHPDRTDGAEDRVVAAAEPRYRVVGVEPHGWSTVLIEDEQGRAYVVTSATGRMAALSPGDAAALIARRDYRPWQGSRAWAPLGRLPLVASAAARSTPPAPAAATESAYS